MLCVTVRCCDGQQQIGIRQRAECGGARRVRAAVGPEIDGPCDSHSGEGMAKRC